MGTRCADHVKPLYPQKLALTSPTGGGRSVGIVRSRTKATEIIDRKNEAAPVIDIEFPLTNNFLKTEAENYEVWNLFTGNQKYVEA